MFRFGDCALDTDNYVLHRGERSIQLSRKVFEVLHYLLEHRNRVVSKHELSEQLWPGQGFSDAALESAMKVVRQSIGDSGRAQRYIRTVRGFGYRFVAAVAEVEASTPHTFHTTPSQNTSPPPRKHATILVVDDDPAIVEVFSAMLSEEGYNVLTANNGGDAVEITSEERPDVIILDVNMPYMDGYEVLDAIRKMNIDTRIIVYSGRFTDTVTATDTAVEFIKRGANDFFTKPFEPEKILVKIKKNLLFENSI